MPNRKHRTISLLLASLMLLASLAGCRKKAGYNPNPNRNEESSPDERTPPPPDQATDSEKTGPRTVQTRVLFDQDGVKLTLTGFREDVSMQQLTVIAQNGGDVPIMVEAQDVSVNGFMVLPIFSIRVDPGNQSNDTISFLTYTLQECGIKEVGTVEMLFNVVNSENWQSIFKTDPITIETSAAKSVTQGEIKTKRVLYEQDGIKISFIGFDEGPGFLIRLFLENDSAENVAMQDFDMHVNGFAVNGIMSCDVNAGKKAITALMVSNDSLKKNNILTVESIDLKFRIRERVNWSTLAESPVVTLQGNE